MSRKISILFFLIFNSHCAFAAPISWAGAFRWPVKAVLKKGDSKSYKPNEQIVYVAPSFGFNEVKVVCSSNQYENTNDFNADDEAVVYDGFFVTYGSSSQVSTSDGRLSAMIGAPVVITVTAKNQGSSGKGALYCAVTDSNPSNPQIKSVPRPMIADISYVEADMPSISVSQSTVPLGECRIGQSVHGEFDITTNVTGGGNANNGTLSWSIRQIGDKYHVVPPPKLFVDKSELVSDGKPLSVGVVKNKQHQADVRWHCAGIAGTREWAGILTYTIE